MHIWEKIRSEPESGAKELVATYSERLYKLAFRLCSNAAQAEDLAMRTLARAMRAERDFPSDAAYFSFFCTILVNLHRDDLRLKGANALVFMEDIPEREDERPDPAASLIAKSDAGGVRRGGLKEPNGYGLYDILGNAWEMVLDWQNGGVALGETDPVGEPAPSAKYPNRRMLKGGGWQYTNKDALTLYWRSQNPCNVKDARTGSRFVLNLVPYGGIGHAGRVTLPNTPNVSQHGRGTRPACPLDLTAKDAKFKR